MKQRRRHSAIWSWPYDSPPPAAGYLYWDAIDPTEAGNQIIGNAAFAAVASAPAPPTLALALIGAAAMLAIRGWAGWRRGQPH